MENMFRLRSSRLARVPKGVAIGQTDLKNNNFAIGCDGATDEYF